LRDDPELRLLIGVHLGDVVLDIPQEEFGF